MPMSRSQTRGYVAPFCYNTIDCSLSSVKNRGNVLIFRQELVDYFFWGGGGGEFGLRDWSKCCPCFSIFLWRISICQKFCPFFSLKLFMASQTVEMLHIFVAFRIRIGAHFLPRTCRNIVVVKRWLQTKWPKKKLLKDILLLKTFVHAREKCCTISRIEVFGDPILIFRSAK